VSAFFLDSSALVKRYVSEPGSAWIQDVTALEASNQIIIARIAWVEVLSALARRQRDVSLSPADVLQAMQSFRYDLDTQYQVVEVSRQLVETAGELVFSHPLRAYDSVQLAAALQIHAALEQAAAAALVFVSADDRLVAAARAEGILADNPNDHVS
jgi:uncharacterized protein